MRRELQNGAELDHGLCQVDEVAASVFEENGDDGANVFWFAAEPDAEGFEAVVFGVDVIDGERGDWNAGGEEGFLIGLSWREGHGFEDELDAIGTLGGGDGQPAECGTRRDVLVFYEAEDGGVETKSVSWFSTIMLARRICMGSSLVILHGELVLANGVHLDHEGCNYS
jgi:hypothetical protein